MKTNLLLNLLGFNPDLTTRQSRVDSVSIASRYRVLAILLLFFTIGIGNVWGTSVTWPQTTALPSSYTNIASDANVQIKVSSTNSYTSPIRVYANTTISIKVASGYTIESVTYVASSTGTYVTNAQNATVSPSVTPTVSSKNVTWSYSSTTTEFTFKPSAQTRSAGITVVYSSTAGGCTVFPTVGSALSSVSATANSITAMVPISAIGGCNITENGLVYSTTVATPTVGAANCTKVTTTACGGTAANKTVTLSDLACGTSYYVRGYATNAAGTSYTDVTSQSTSACPKYTVTYDNNGGDGIMPDNNSPYASGATVTVLSNTFTAPSGKMFDHWDTADDDSGTDYDPGNTFTISCNTTLYAQWIDIPDGDNYELVTDASTLKNGDEIIILDYENAQALSTTQNNNNRSGVGNGLSTWTISGTTVIVIGSTVQTLTISPGSTESSYWQLYTGSGYLYAASNSSNHLKTQASNDVNGEWAITISSGVASIVASGSSNRNVMQYNYNNGSPIFSCYTTASQTALRIYKKVIDNPTYDITYNCNGATSGCPSNSLNQTALPDPLPSAPTKECNTFVGWYTNEGLTVEAVAGAALSDDVTLYAKWTITSYSVTWMVNGSAYTPGSSGGTNGSPSVNCGTRISTLPTSPDTDDFCGDIFVGWTTDAEYVHETSPLFTVAGSAPIASGDQIFYAVFADYDN